MKLIGIDCETHDPLLKNQEVRHGCLMKENFSVLRSMTQLRRLKKSFSLPVKALKIYYVMKM